MDEFEEFESYLYFVLGRSENTTQSYIKDLKDIKELLNEKSFREIDERDVETLINRMKEFYDTTSINRKLSALRCYLKFIARQKNETELLKKIKKIKNLKDSREIPKVPDESEITSKIEGIPISGFESVRDRLILELLYGSGLRVSELVNLKVNDITEKDIIKVEGKGRKQRFIPISTEAKKIVPIYLDERRKINPKTDYLITNAKGKKITRQGVWLILKRYGLYPHLLRHSFATHLVQRGMNIRNVQVMLGHSNLSTTEIYTKIAPNILKETIARSHPLSRTKFKIRNEPSST